MYPTSFEASNPKFLPDGPTEVTWICWRHGALSI